MSILDGYTDAEKKVFYAIFDGYFNALERVRREGAPICICRGLEREITPELKALVDKTLDAEVHGSTLREYLPKQEGRVERPPS